MRLMTRCCRARITVRVSVYGVQLGCACTYIPSVNHIQLLVDRSLPLNMSSSTDRTSQGLPRVPRLLPVSMLPNTAWLMRTSYAQASAAGRHMPCICRQHTRTRPSSARCLASCLTPAAAQRRVHSPNRAPRPLPPGPAQLHIHSGKAVLYECNKQRAGDETPYPRYGTAQRQSYYNAFNGKCER